MEISNELMFNIIKDFEKKNISNLEKGEFIRLYLKENNMSQRSLAKLLGVPYSTLHDWISNRQMKKYYSDKDTKNENKMMDIVFDKDDKKILLTNDLKKDINLFKISDYQVKNNVFTLIDRLNFLLIKSVYLSEKEFNKLLELEKTISLIKLKNKK